MNTLLYDRLANASHSRDGKDVTAKRSATGDNYQSLKLFTRLLWKEYRQLRPIWITLALIVFVIASLMALGIFIQHPALTGNLILFVPCLFALSAGALFFANEREQGTDRWLAQWAVPTIILFAAKYAVALSGIFLLGLFAASIAYLFGLPFYMPEDNVSYFGPIKLAVAGMIGCYVFTSTASIASSRVLVSAAVGGTMTWTMIFFCGEYLTGGHKLPVVDPLLSTIFITSPVAFLTLLAACLLVTPLMLERRLSERPVWRSADRDNTVPPSVDQIFHQWLTPRPSTALLWKEFRQSRLWVLGIVAFTVYLLLGVTCLGWTKSRTPFAAGVSASYLSMGSFEDRPVEVLFLFISSIFMGVAYLSGLLTFVAEQRGRSFRFLTHQGVSARQLWMFKQAFWLPIILVWIALLIFSSFTGKITQSYLWASWGMLTAFAILQLAVLLIRQTIVAIAAGVCSCAILLYYSFAMTLLDVPLWILVIPLPLFLLLSSFALSQIWMEEQNGWRVVAQKFALVAAPLVLLFIAPCLYRAFEIRSTQATDLIPTHCSPATSEEIATANAYADLFRRARSINEGELKRYSAHWSPLDHKSECNVVYSNELLAELVDITKRPHGTFTRLTPGSDYEWTEAWNEKTSFQLLASILFDAANSHEQRKEWTKSKEMHLAILRLIDHAVHHGHAVLRSEIYKARVDALLGLFRWAKHSSTSVDQVVELIEHLKEKAVTPLTLLEEWCLADRGMHTSEYPHHFSTGLMGTAYFLTPWEMSRSSRLKEYQHAYQLKELESLVDSPSRWGSLRSRRRFWPVHDYPWRQWERNTPSDYRPLDYGGRWEVAAQWNLAALAAVAWMKKYGDLPDPLAEARKEFIGDVPVPAWNVWPFQILRLGNRFQITELDEEQWKRLEWTVKHTDPNIDEEVHFYWRARAGYSIDPSEK